MLSTLQKALLQYQFAPVQKTSAATLQPAPSPVIPYLIWQEALRSCSQQHSFEGCESFAVFLCVPAAAEHSIWCCICLMATALPPTQSHTFSSLNLSFLLYHSLSCFCAVNRDGEGMSVQVYMCGSQRRSALHLYVAWQLSHGKLKKIPLLWTERGLA